MRRSKRSRIELYADTLRTIRTYEGGCRITKLSYGSNMPLDRAKKIADELISYGLISRRIEDPSIYMITARGIEFLDAFKKLSLFLEGSRKSEGSF